MQLLSLVAMEAPANLSADSIRDEKVKVLESIRPFPTDMIDSYAIRGQYGEGFINGEKVKGYREEENVNPQSFVETYASLKLYIDNWRWTGVPFSSGQAKGFQKERQKLPLPLKKPPGIF